MAERKGSHRTSKGIELQNKHEANYKKWWLGKTIRTNNIDKDGNFITGKVNKVECHGNSVTMVVLLHLEDGTKYFVPHRGAHRPRKKDVEILN